jgi:hypothetical protein
VTPTNPTDRELIASQQEALLRETKRADVAIARAVAAEAERDALAELACEGNEREKALEAERDEARKALNGFVWLNDNIHNYGSSRWLEFWDSAIQDCCAALAAPTKEDTDD